jgi:hypothetical protein
MVASGCLAAVLLDVERGSAEHGSADVHDAAHCRFIAL